MYALQHCSRYSPTHHPTPAPMHCGLDLMPACVVCPAPVRPPSRTLAAGASRAPQQQRRGGLCIQVAKLEVSKFPACGPASDSMHCDCSRACVPVCNLCLRHHVFLRMFSLFSSSSFLVVLLSPSLSMCSGEAAAGGSAARPPTAATRSATRSGAAAAPRGCARPATARTATATATG